MAGAGEKISLTILKEQVSQCTKCPELVQNRTQPVFGEGNPNAEIMIISEGPGRDEDKQGRPFVGAAGRLLNNIIASMGWQRENLYITNTVRCRPPNNRTPTEEECKNCRPFLDAQISLVKPKYLILLGSTASGNIFGKKISEMRSSIYGIHNYNGIKTVCTYHPAYLIYNPSKKKDVWEDLQVIT